LRFFSGAVPEPSRVAWHATRKIVPFSRKSAFATASASPIRRPHPRISHTQIPVLGIGTYNRAGRLRNRQVR
jgi:hypothetical protein